MNFFTQVIIKVSTVIITAAIAVAGIVGIIKQTLPQEAPSLNITNTSTKILNSQEKPTDNSQVRLQEQSQIQTLKKQLIESREQLEREKTIQKNYRYRRINPTIFKDDKLNIENSNTIKTEDPLIKIELCKTIAEQSAQHKAENEIAELNGRASSQCDTNVDCLLNTMKLNESIVGHDKKQYYNENYNDCLSR